MSDGDPDLVIARGLDHGVGARRVFGGLDFRLPAGTLGVVYGTDGSGRSTLLLALIGRVRGVQGSLQVAGHDAFTEAKLVRRISTAARIGELVDLEPKHSLADAVQDRAAVEGLGAPAATRRYREIAEVLGLQLPDAQLVEDLDGFQRTLLALMLASLRPSDLIVLDDADRALNVDDQDRLYQAIGTLMEHTGSTVVVSTAEPETIPYDAVRIDLPAPGSADPHSR